MTPRTDDELERRLAAWLEDRAPSMVPADLTRRVGAIPATPPSSSRLGSLLDRLVPPGRRNPMLSATRVIAAVAVVAIATGGLLLAAGQLRPVGPDDPAIAATTAVPSSGPVKTPRPSTAVAPTPAATEAPDPSPLSLLPRVVPSGVASGTLGTPLGIARWVHLAGDRTTLPDPIVPEVRRGMLVWFEPGGACVDGRADCPEQPARLSTGTDVLSPRREHALPATAGPMWLSDDGVDWWLGGPDGAHLWRSADLDQWQAIDASALTPPSIAGLTWDPWLGMPIRAGDRTIVPVSWTIADPGAIVGFPGRSIRLERTGPDTYGLVELRRRSMGANMDLGTLRVERTATGLRLLDGAGTLLADLPGVDTSFLDGWADHGLVRTGVAALDGDRLIPSDLLLDADPEGVAFLGSPEGWIATSWEADHQLRTWRSADGLAWTDHGPARTTTGAPIRGEWVTVDEQLGERQLSVSTSEGGSRWVSADGEHWVAVPERSSMPGGARVPAGFIRLDEDGTWEMSANGVEWEAVPGLSRVITRWMPEGAGGTSLMTIGDTFAFIVQDDDSGARDLWILRWLGDTAGG